MLKVVIIGSGNVAQHLIGAFQKSDKVELTQVYARNTEKLQHLHGHLSVTDDFNRIAESDVYIIAVSDDAINSVSEQLAFSGRLVVHTSGSTAMESIDSKNRRGVFYPLQTFSMNKEVDFTKIPVCLETEDPSDYALLEELAKSISPLTYSISTTQRQALHVAAVFVNNFTNHLYTVGNDICTKNNIPFDILKPLIWETANKISTLTPVEAQTGPAKRNDTTTLHRHLDFLKDDNQKAIYTLLTHSIQSKNG